MAKERRAAFEELGDSPLEGITAAQLLEATSQMDHRIWSVWPEKKKVELETEPGVLGKVRLKDLVVRLQNEKKKYELEIDPVVPRPSGVQDFKTEKKKVELEIEPVGGSRLPSGGFINEKKKRELEIDLGSGGGLGLDMLLEKLEERFRDRGES